MATWVHCQWRFKNGQGCWIRAKYQTICCKCCQDLAQFQDSKPWWISSLILWWKLFSRTFSILHRTNTPHCGWWKGGRNTQQTIPIKININPYMIPEIFPLASSFHKILPPIFYERVFFSPFCRDFFHINFPFSRGIFPSPNKRGKTALVYH